MKKQTKQQKIEHLGQSLLEESQKRNRMEQMLYTIKAELWGSNSHTHALEDILEEIKIRNKNASDVAFKRDMLVEMLREENLRYWTLIRSLTGDKTLEKEIERTGRVHDGFGNIIN